MGDTFPPAPRRVRHGFALAPSTPRPSPQPSPRPSPWPSPWPCP